MLWLRIVSPAPLMPLRLTVLIVVICAQIQVASFADTASAANVIVDDTSRVFFETYCTDCHNPEKRKGKFDLESLLERNPADHVEAWEEVLWMLEDREMPPEDE
mgnify:CR=1 FL=1